MARNALALTRYHAERVLMPREPGSLEVMEALRIVVYGPHFPQRAIEPDLLVGEAVAKRSSIARDQCSLRGYFPEDPAEGAVIRVRYADSLEGILDEPFCRAAIRPLPKGCGERA